MYAIVLPKWDYIFKSMKPTIQIKKFLLSPLAALGVMLMLLEEYLWAGFVQLGQWVGRLPAIRSVEDQIRHLPPNMAALVLFVPVLCVLPIKILAVWIMSTGRWGMGIGVLIGAKLTGTAVIARIYTLCEPSLSTLPWFVKLREMVYRAKTWAHRRLNAWPIWRLTRRTVGRLIRSLRAALSPS
jgi:hypothetical protein